MLLLSCGAKPKPKPGRRVDATVHPDSSRVNGGIYTLQEALKASRPELPRAIAASNGLHAALRMSLWPALLELVPWPHPPFDGRSPWPATLEAEFSTLIAQTDTVEKGLKATIDADVPRTDASLTGPRASVLRDLLLAHCVIEPKWGYFQGMNDIARIVLAAHESSLNLGSDGSPAAVVQQTPFAADAVHTTPVAPSAAIAPSIQPHAPKAEPNDVHSPGQVFWLLRGVLSHASSNWAHEDLGGVWRQARAVHAVLWLIDPKLMRLVDGWDRGVQPEETTTSKPAKKLRNSHEEASGAMSGTRAALIDESAKPLAFLFGPIFLRLKREMASNEEVMRLWEICWANGDHFHVLAIAAFVRVLRERLLRIKDGPAAIGEVHRLFGTMHGTQRAATLLTAARAIRAKPGVREVLEAVLGPTHSRPKIV